MSYCTACGQPRAGTARYCTACGAPFPGPPAGPGPGEPGGPDDDFFSHLFRPDPAPAPADHTRPIPAPPVAGPGRAGFGPPPRPRPGTAGRRVVLAVGVLILLAAAGTGAWLVFRHARPGPPSAAGGTASPAGPSAHSTASRRQGSSPAADAGRIPVAVAPWVPRQPPAPRVIAFLHRYFTAINRHSYRRFAVLLGPRMRQSLPAPAFYAGYRTTTDSAAMLTGLSAAGGGRVVADVSFTSHQAPADTPSRSRCTHWRVVMVLAPRNGGLVLTLPPPGYHASYQAC